MSLDRQVTVDARAAREYDQRGQRIDDVMRAGHECGTDQSDVQNDQRPEPHTAAAECPRDHHTAGDVKGWEGDQSLDIVETNDLERARPQAFGMTNESGLIEQRVEAVKCERAFGWKQCPREERD